MKKIENSFSVSGFVANNAEIRNFTTSSVARFSLVLGRTELCLVLNHKIWQWYERDNQKAVLYDKLWREADEMTSEWSDEKQEYYFQVTD